MSDWKLKMVDDLHAENLRLRILANLFFWCFVILGVVYIGELKALAKAGDCVAPPVTDGTV